MRRRDRAEREKKCPGTAFRLYLEETFTIGMYATHVPDTVNISPIPLILKLRNFGVRSVMEFGFIDPLDVMAVFRGVGSLKHLVAFASTGTGEVLSVLGEKMARLLTTPELTLCLNRAHQLVVVGLMIALVSVIKEKSMECFLMERRPDDQAAFKRSNSKFHDKRSEHWRLVKVFLLFKENTETKGDGSHGRR